MTAAAVEAVVRRNRRRRLPSRGRIAVLVLLTFAALVLVLIPAWAVVVNSFKTLGESRHVGLGLPEQWVAIENYARVIDKSDFLTGLRNSLLVTVGTVSVVLLLGSMASWVFARSTSRWARVWYLWVSAAFLKAYCAVAGQGAFLPQTREERQVLLDAYLLEKVLYELRYELNSRPDWVNVPLQGILDLVEAA